MTANMTPWTYKLDDDKDDIHVYDENGNELQDSPIGTDGSFEIPKDIMPLIASEMSYEYQNNGFSERMQKMIIILSDESLLVKR